MSSYFDHFLIIFYFSYFSNILTVSLTSIIIAIFLNNITNLNPSSIQTILMTFISHWNENLNENIGSSYNFFSWPIFSLFMFILTVNILGFIIHVFPITTLINITFALAILIWLGIIILAAINFSTNFLALLMPSGAPLGLSPLLMLIEIISNLSSPVALGMSLAANLTAGHILMSILASFSVKILLASSALISVIPIIIMISTTALEIAVIFIQAYVFTLLTTIYLNESIIMH